MKGSSFLLLFIVLFLGILQQTAYAGNQQNETLAATVRIGLTESLSDQPAPVLLNLSKQAAQWMQAQDQKLQPFIHSDAERQAFLQTVFYESLRAGFDPNLILSVIQVESRFNKYAVSSQGARGYMQVMPFWVSEIGQPSDDLFHLRTNLRYGCTLLRYYLDTEKGNLFLALGRYNGSRSEIIYPEHILKIWQSQIIE